MFPGRRWCPRTRWRPCASSCRPGCARWPRSRWRRAGRCRTRTRGWAAWRARRGCAPRAAPPRTPGPAAPPAPTPSCLRPAPRPRSRPSPPPLRPNTTLCFLSSTKELSVHLGRCPPVSYLRPANCRFAPDRCGPDPSTWIRGARALIENR